MQAEMNHEIILARLLRCGWLTSFLSVAERSFLLYDRMEMVV